MEGKRVLELGAGTGVVGIALAKCKAHSIVITDKHSQIPLMRRNFEHNKSSVPISVEVLCWEPARWRRESVAVAVSDAFDTIIACDCVYPSQSSAHLAGVLLELMELNPHATVLVAFERRPPPEGSPSGTDHPAEFFKMMNAGCDAVRLDDKDIDPAWRYDELSIWRMTSFQQKLTNI